MSKSIKYIALPNKGNDQGTSKSPIAPKRKLSLTLFQARSHIAPRSQLAPITERERPLQPKKTYLNVICSKNYSLNISPSKSRNKKWERYELKTEQIQYMNKRGRILWSGCNNYVSNRDEPCQQLLRAKKGDKCYQIDIKLVQNSVSEIAPETPINKLTEINIFSPASVVTTTY